MQCASWQEGAPERPDVRLRSQEPRTRRHRIRANWSGSADSFEIRKASSRGPWSEAPQCGQTPMPLIPPVISCCLNQSRGWGKGAGIERPVPGILSRRDAADVIPPKALPEGSPKRRSDRNPLKGVRLLCRFGRNGGWGGIRTHGALARTPVFKTGALNRSATHPARATP